MPVPLKTVKKGDYFRLVGGKSVYVKGDYDRSSKKYECCRFDDANAFRLFKGDKMVDAEFTF